MVRSIIRNKNVKNGIWLYLLQVFNTIIPLLTIPYITRVLGRGEYGTFSIALNVMGYLQVLVEYGFGMSATREVAISKKDNERVSKVFTGVLLSRFILLILAVGISACYLIVTGANGKLRACMIIMIICLVGYCIQQNWLFQGMQEMKYISIVSIVSRTISTALIFLLVKTDRDLILYSLLYTISPFLSGVIGLTIAVFRYKVYLMKANFAMVKQNLKSGWYVFTTQLSSKVFGAIGITFLGIYSTNVEVGTFSAIQKIPNVMMLAWAPISQVMYPIVSQKMTISFSEGEAFVSKMRKIFLGLFSLGALLIAVFSKHVVRIAFGDAYALKYYWIIPLLLWTVLSIANNFMGIQTLLSSNHDKEYSICFQTSVVFTIIINLLFVYFWGGDGAAIAPVLSEMVLSVTLIYQIHKIRHAHKEKKGIINE